MGAFRQSVPGTVCRQTRFLHSSTTIMGGYGSRVTEELQGERFKSSLVEWAARRRKLTPTDFRGADGAQPYPAPASRTFPNAVRSLDGHLWFSTGDGISEVTPPAPGALRGNEFQVRIEDVAVDGIPAVARERLRFAPGTRSIQIGFTALTLSNPDTIRFRYRLEGVNKNWINVDSRRTAFYNNLKPGEYQFRVSASASGTDQWRDAPALELEQLPLLLSDLVVHVAGVDGRGFGDHHRGVGGIPSAPLSGSPATRGEACGAHAHRPRTA